jgi:hypothetical protein
MHRCSFGVYQQEVKKTFVLCPYATSLKLGFRDVEFLSVVNCLKLPYIKIIGHWHPKKNFRVQQVRFSEKKCCQISPRMNFLEQNL